MRTLGNILWHIPFLGFIVALENFIIGGLFTITVIGSPVGIGLIELSKFYLAPFSRSMINKKMLNKKQNRLWQTYGIIIRIIWFPFGLILAVQTILLIAGLFVSIIGIPVALVLAKALSTYFNPVNKKCVPRAVAEELHNRKAKEQIDKHIQK